MKRPDPRYGSPFWRNATITSFGHLFPDNYDGVMLEFSRSQIDAGLRHIVDVARGNGALSWIASDITAGAGATTRITGVDLAAIEPFRALGGDPADYPRVSVLASTPAESLSLPDACADLVISQYGIEYSDLEKSIPETARLLGPQGRMAFILHDKQSVIVLGATQHLGDFRRARDEIRLHELCLEQGALLGSDRNFKRLSATPAWRELEARVAEAQYRLRLMLRTHPATSPVIRYAEQVGQALQLKSAKQAAQRQALASQAAAALNAHIERVEDLWLAARSAEARERLAALVREQGFTVTGVGELRYRDGDNFGTTFTAARRPR